MSRWLVMVAAVPLIAASGAQAQMNGLIASDVAQVATVRALDLRLSQELGRQRPAPLIRGMLVHHDIAPNAVIGLGLANIYARRKGSADWRVGEPSSRSRKPAVTFVFRF